MIHTNVVRYYAPKPNTGGAIAPAQPATVTPPVTPPPAPAEVTSPKLLEIRAAMDAIFAKQDAFTKDTPRKDKLDANLELFKLTNDEKAEQANIKKAEADAKIAEARNARVKMLDDLLSAYTASQAAIGSGMPIEESNVLNDTYHKLREEVVNQLLAKFAGSAPAKTAKDGTVTVSTGTKGATGQRIRAAFIANRTTGMTDTDNVKAIIASGESRGTTGAEVLKYQREIGEKA